MSRLAAVILCGGRSSRMGGGDKPLLDLGGRPLLAHALDRLDGTIDTAAINANGEPGRFAAFGLPVIADATDTFDGPLAGILAGMGWAKAQRCRRLLTVAGDTPFFPADIAARLAAAASPPAIALAASRGRVHPTFALWPVSLHGDLADRLAGGMRRVVDFIARHPSIAVDFPPIDGVDPFFNVNTPEDLAEARRIAAKLAS